MITGDELSKRAKFAFVTWIGPSVSALKRARVSIDKALVKEVISVGEEFINMSIISNFHACNKLTFF